MIKKTTMNWMVVSTLVFCVGLPAIAQDEAVPAVEHSEVPVVGLLPEETAPDLETQEDGDEASSPHGGSILSDRMGRWSQRAMAARLDAELEGLLHDDGLLLESGSTDLRHRLLDVATRCDLLVRSADEPLAKQMLFETQARSYNALAQDAIASGQAIEGARQLRLLRRAAGRLSQVDTLSASAISAYWEMLADLIDANRTIASPHDRHLFARELLTRYVESHGQDEALQVHYVTDAQLALAQMLDQVGNQAKAAQVLGPLGEIDPNDPRYAEVQTVVEHLVAMGQVIEIDLPTSRGPNREPNRGHRWQSETHLGRHVLIHIYAAGIGPSTQTIRSLQETVADSTAGGFDMLSIRIGPTDDLNSQEVIPPWPTALADPTLPATAELLEALGVNAVPAFVWLDEEGKLASIGLTLEVLDHRPLVAASDGDDIHEDVDEEAGIEVDDSASE